MQLKYMFKKDLHYWNVYVFKSGPRFKVATEWGKEGGMYHYVMKRSNFQHLWMALDCARDLYKKRLKSGYILEKFGVVNEDIFYAFDGFVGGLFTSGIDPPGATDLRNPESDDTV